MLDRSPDRARDVQPRPLRRRARPPVAAAEAERGPQLRGNGVVLAAGALGALGIVERLGLVAVGLELVEPPPVRGLGSRIEHRPEVGFDAPHAGRGVLPLRAAARR